MLGMKTESPRLLARPAGVFFLLTIVGGIIAQACVSERLINFSDAAATANNILANRQMFQIGFTVYLMEMVFQLITGLLLYRLLRLVNPTLSLLMLLFELTGIIIKTFARVFYITPLWVLDGSGTLAGLDAGQLQSIVLVFLKVNDFGAATALAFFGFSTTLAGYLVFLDLPSSLVGRARHDRRRRMAYVHLSAAWLPSVYVRRPYRTSRRDC